jgi:hypothetical protein
MKALFLFSLILLLFSSDRQLKIETESAGRLDGIQPFLGQNGRIPTGWLGSGRSPAVRAGDPVLSRPERPNPGRDSTLSRPEWLDPSRLAGILPFPGQNVKGSCPFLAGIRPLWLRKGQNEWPEVGGRGKMEGGGGEEIRREKKKTKKKKI